MLAQPLNQRILVTRYRQLQLSQHHLKFDLLLFLQEFKDFVSVLSWRCNHVFVFLQFIELPGLQEIQTLLIHFLIREDLANDSEEGLASSYHACGDLVVECCDGKPCDCIIELSAHRLRNFHCFFVTVQCNPPIQHPVRLCTRAQSAEDSHLPWLQLRHSCNDHLTVHRPHIIEGKPAWFIQSLIKVHRLICAHDLGRCGVEVLSCVRSRQEREILRVGAGEDADQQGFVFDFFVISMDLRDPLLI
mmetsp:Transcript_56438/g.100399  ORF Transcript_56438/g.100399 Transcript_56438/m.100399 type:complete len:246 (-) Transcript_56438:3867-4604(-)